jgi:hypothetical protein
MNAERSKILAEWLEKIETGEATLESLAVAHPDLAAELSGLVETAGAVRAAAHTADAEGPSGDFRAQARSRILNTVGGRVQTRQSERVRPPRRVEIAGLRRVFTGVAVAVGLLILGVAGSIPMQNALPGDVLYGGKLALEGLQLLSASPAEDAILQTRFASNRLTEIQLLIVQARYDDVDVAVGAYEENINRAVLALAELSREDGSQTYPILKQIEVELDDYSATLGEMLAFVPDRTQRVLAQAIEASQVWSGESN